MCKPKLAEIMGLRSKDGQAQNRRTIAYRANLEFNYAKGLQKLSIKLTKALQSIKKKYMKRKLGKAIELEAIKPTHQVQSVHEKKRKSLDNEVEKMANLYINNWNQQMKLLNKLKKSTEKLAKDENYYQNNITGCSTRLKWENTLENCYQSILELEKERIQLLCKNLNQYTQHISVLGQTLTTCHAQIHCAFSKIDVEKNIQALVEETAISSTENKSEFLLTDYFEEDLNNAMNKERWESSMKSKPSRLQRDIEKTSRDQEGLQRMLKTYSNNSCFSDPESQKNTAALMDETNLKLDLLQANSYELLSVLAELKQRPQPSHSCSNSIFKWKEKQQTHSYVKLFRPFLMTRSENVVSREPSGGQNNPSSSTTASSVVQHSNNLCKASYPFQARQDDKLNLEKGDIVTLHQKKEGWCFGSLKGKKGDFPAAYVEELPCDAGDIGVRRGCQRATLHTL